MICSEIRQRKATTATAIAVVLGVALLLVTIQPASAQTYSILHTFPSTDTNDLAGYGPQGPLTVGTDNQLYGVTYGLQNPNRSHTSNYGNIFKMTRTGDVTILLPFNSTEGADPIGGLLQMAGSGNWYGTTFFGGPNGTGVLYELSPDNQQIVLHNFGPYMGQDGYAPSGGVVADAESNLYGVTRNGGTTNNGTVYKFDQAGNETILYSFLGQADGSTPIGPLTWGPDGNLYGVTSCSYTCYSGGGTVFKIDTTGNFTTLFSFDGGTQGNVPNAPVLFDSNGNLFGTTYFGGIPNCGSYFLGCGVVFKLNTNYQETVLYDFTGQSDGNNPSSAVVSDAQGNVYGTTQTGGNVNIGFGGCGVAYKLNPQGVETVMHAFEAGGDGCGPVGDVLLSGDVIFGTTGGGVNFGGTVYTITLQ